MRSPSRQILVAMAATLAAEHEKAATIDAKIGISNAVIALADTFANMEGNFDRKRFIDCFEANIMEWMNGNRSGVLNRMRGEVN